MLNFFRRKVDSKIHPYSESEIESFAKLSRRQQQAITRMRDQRLFNESDGIPIEFKGGGAAGWQECLEAQIADGTQISNSTSETIVCPDFNIPAYYMAPGRTLRVWAYGVMSNVVTTPGTLTMRLRWGGVSGTVLVASAAQGLDTTARTNSMWMLHCLITCRTAGATGTFMSGGIMFGNVLSTTAANLLPALLGSAGNPLASANAAVTVDTTAAKLLSVTAQFSVSTNPTNLTCQSRIVEVLN